VWVVLALRERRQGDALSGEKPSSF